MDCKSLNLSLLKIILGLIFTEKATILPQGTQDKTNTTQAISKKEKLDVKNLTETDKTIINTIINNPEMSQKQIADNLNWTVNKVKYYIKKFKQKNILRYEGTSQNGKWGIQEENLKYFLK